MSKLSVLTIAMTLCIAFGPSANAASGHVAALRPPAPLEQSSDCDLNYSGACVPAGASDVDCAGGGGNGPEYVSGPVYVEGDDVHELDRDGDGVACESTN